MACLLHARLTAAAFLAAVLAACHPAAAWAQAQPAASAPVAASPAFTMPAYDELPAQAKPGQSAAAPDAPGTVIVATARPDATEAGLAVLRAGGSAVDAAVAIQAVLGLTEPQSSGLAGGAFMIVAKPGAPPLAFDGRESAPMGAGNAQFIGPDGKPIAWLDAVVTGRAIGVPGVVPMLELAHKRFGRLEWGDLFGDAERLARDGFIVGQRLAHYVAGTFPQASRPDVVAYFRRPDGSPIQEGDRLRNPAYAATVRAVAAQGAAALAQGPIAAAILAKAGEEPLPGTLTLADLQAYRPREAPAVCQPWLGGAYRVCSAPPPSAAVTLLHALALLEAADIARHGHDDPAGWWRLGRAEMLLYADRDRWLADPAFVPVPVAGLLDPSYIRQRAAILLDPNETTPSFGTPPGAAPTGADTTREAPGTSHFVVRDAAGLVVSVTTSIESVFGTGRMAGGMFLNNQLTDFGFVPTLLDGVPAANRVEPGKRPRSSMSPVIVLDAAGVPVAALGSPGGSSILSYNLKALTVAFAWGRPLAEAVGVANLVARDGRWRAEMELLPPGVAEGLAQLGVKLIPSQGEASGLHGFVIREGRIEAAADPRREGTVAIEVLPVPKPATPAKR